MVIYYYVLVCGQDFVPFTRCTEGLMLFVLIYILNRRVKDEIVAQLRWEIKKMGHADLLFESWAYGPKLMHFFISQIDALSHILSHTLTHYEICGFSEWLKVCKSESIWLIKDSKSASTWPRPLSVRLFVLLSISWCYIFFASNVLCIVNRAVYIQLNWQYTDVENHTRYLCIVMLTRHIVYMTVSRIHCWTRF